MSIHVFGIRHHGPGCARALRRALEELAPDVVLVEGPPDAAAVLPLAADPEMTPPVALLVYAPDSPRQAVFYPFAEFSPEWQAIQLALARGTPVRFMDLPQAIQLAGGGRGEAKGAASEESEAGGEAPASEAVGTAPDPLALLAEAAGYDDHELWWDAEIERRRDATGVFDGIMEAMSALREARDGGGGDGADHGDDGLWSRRERLREAFMRQTIRAAVKEGFERIAVVCGAWHAPVLREPGPAKADQALLKGLPKRKVVATWIPWTNAQLSIASGYGAGVTRPGWYEHLWRSPERPAVRWSVDAARLLREQELDASSASVIETVRLAEALAALRDLRSPGLAELDDATLAVLCGGDAAPLALVAPRLHVGDRLGTVPAGTPRVPLREDLASELSRLRLKPATEVKTLDLDLRRELDRDRSRLLHRLSVMAIDWARLLPVEGKAGTFHELWELHYRPELEVAVIAAAVWGNSVAEAATACVARDAVALDDVAPLTELLDRAVLAELDGAVESVLRRLQDTAAIATDVPRLMEALPALARIARYGDVRRTPTERILPLVDGLFERAVIGLPAACASLDDDAARAMADALSRLQAAVRLLEREGQREEWQGALRRLVEGAAQGLVAGHACRLLLELAALGDEELARLASLALSPGTPPAEAAAWCEGLLRGSGIVLLHREALWRALDAWVVRLPAELFGEMLPLVRRAFAGFEAAELRAMGERVRRLGSGRASAAATELEGVDPRRAALVLPVLAQILGGASPVSPGGGGEG